MIRKILIKYRFWLLLALLFASQVAIVGIFFMAVRVDLDAAQRALLDQLVQQRAAPLALLAVVLLTAQGLALKALILRYLAPLARMAEEAVLLTSNPGHRVVPQGARQVRELAASLNTLAASHQQLHEDVQARIDAAGRALAEERNRFAALMSELAQSVVVCNIEGSILLYNTRARQLFERGQGSAPSSIGLGRSVFGLIERGLIVHALEQLQYRLRQAAGAATPLSVFVTRLKEGQIVRVSMAPVLDGTQTLDGFVLTLEDISRMVEADVRHDRLYQLLTQDTRAALTNIRAAVAILQRQAGIDDARRLQLAAIADDEAQRLSRQIDELEQRYADERVGQWQQEEMRAADLLALLAKRIGSAALRMDEDCDPTLWLQLDSHAVTHALAHLAQRLLHDHGVAELRVGLRRGPRGAQLELGWRGTAPDPGSLHAWENESLHLSAGDIPQTPASVVAAHGGETECRFDAAASLASYRVHLPLAASRAAQDILPRPPGRPEFYDFDLFHRRGLSAALDERLLSELTYTVFDTETTGLHPEAGDEIISIGALRIVNGRLLERESFDQLVRPGQPLRPESTAIHGIDDAMLKGRPRIGDVLPQFHRFAEDTVLVGHNAAFDMKFLQMKEEQTGVCFRQPVLDTLLLSQVLHPHQQQHTLEALARRFGVEIFGRHTALGDAAVTGEVFLKMIPLLAEKGIFTLKQACEAAQQTAYARIRY